MRSYPAMSQPIQLFTSQNCQILYVKTQSIANMICCCYSLISNACASQCWQLEGPGLPDSHFSDSIKTCIWAYGVLYVLDTAMLYKLARLLPATWLTLRLVYSAPLENATAGMSVDVMGNKAVACAMPCCAEPCS